MAEGSLLTDKIQAVIGQLTEPVVLKVEQGAIVRYCDAVGDDNPLFRDVEYAKKSRYGGIVAPPAFFGWPVKGGGVEGAMGKSVEAVAESGMLRILDGGVDLEFYQPVYAGDTLITYGVAVDAREKTTKQGAMLFLVIESRYINQNGDKVAISRATLICS
ncbi:MAG: MaoC family dehydratase N-terminal domain-containing protein [Chloroflexota bacterium]|nr:MaoC family dehydratase N-terminal domain-containing protein [Chloroflexota bacterium]